MHMSLLLYRMDLYNTHRLLCVLSGVRSELKGEAEIPPWPFLIADGVGDFICGFKMVSVGETSRLGQ